MNSPQEHRGLEPPGTRLEMATRISLLHRGFWQSHRSPFLMATMSVLLWEYFLALLRVAFCVSETMNSGQIAELALDARSAYVRGYVHPWFSIHSGRAPDSRKLQGAWDHNR